MSNRDIVLRPYQEQVNKAIDKTAKRGIKRQLVVMSTGLGKSFTLVFKILRSVKENKKVLILVDQKDLVQQWKDYLQNVDESLRIGIERASHRAKKTDQVVIATVQTLGRKGKKRIKRFDPDHFSLAVCDECFTGDVEILTEDGFIRFDELPKNKRVAQYDNGDINFVKPLRHIEKEYNGDMYKVSSDRGIDLDMTAGHEFLIDQPNGEFKKERCEDVKFYQGKDVHVAGNGVGLQNYLGPFEKLMIALQADGSIHNINENGTSSLLFTLAKERKINNLKNILNQCGITYSEVKPDTRNKKIRRKFIVYDVPNACKNVQKHFSLDKLSSQKAKQIIDECVKWDGHNPKDRDNGLYYSSTTKEAVDFFQSVAILAGYKTYKSIQTDDRKESYQDVHRLFITTDRNKISTDTFKKEKYNYNGKVYCVQVPAGNIIVRRNGKPIVIGNCHKSIATTWFRTLEYFGFGKDSFNQDNLLIGCTATPFRSSGESLGILYDDIVANYDLSFAINEGWLTDFELYEVSTNTDLTGAKTQGEVDSAVDNHQRNLQALKSYKEFSQGEQALIYTASVDHAYKLRDLFNANDIPSAVIEANTPDDEREQILQDYKDKKIQCIHNYATMTTGVDLPETSTLMFLRPVGSKLLITQCLGRGLRPSSTAFVDAFDSAKKRRDAISHSAKPVCKVIDMHDKVANQNFAHIPSLFGLNNELKTNEPKKFYKEVVEPIEDKAKEHGFDKTKVTNLDDIDLIVKNRKVDIASLKTDPKIEQFTSRRWISVGENSYEIIYGDENKVLMIEPDQSKDELLDKKEWNLLEYDTKDETTKKLQTFNSLSGAFKVGDEYADQSGWNSTFKKKAEWMSNPPSEKQIELLKKLYTYKTGYSEIRTLNERYSNGARKVLFKKTGDILDRGSASTLIENKFSS